MIYVKSFSRNSQLTRHKRIHSGEKQSNINTAPTTFFKCGKVDKMEEIKEEEILEEDPLSIEMKTENIEIVDTFSLMK